MDKFQKPSVKVGSLTTALILKVSGRHIQISALLEVLRIVFLLSGPMVLRSLLAYLEEKDIKRTGDPELLAASEIDEHHHSNWYGIRCCIWLVLVGFFSSLCETHSYYHLNSGGILMKSAIISAVYRKSLKVLEPNGKQ